MNGTCLKAIKTATTKLEAAIEVKDAQIETLNNDKIEKDKKIETLSNQIIEINKLLNIQNNS